MLGQVRRRCFVATLFLLTALPGCLSFVNPVPPPLDDTKLICDHFPADCRAGVHIFLVNGCDPLECANLRGVRDYLNKLGFKSVWYGQFYHDEEMAAEVCRVRRDNPMARIIVVGYEHGANGACGIAHAAIDNGGFVDMLVLLEPKCLGTIVPPRRNVGRFVVIRTEPGLLSGMVPEGAEVITLQSYWRFTVPTHTTTLELIADEAIQAAQMVPIEMAKSEAFPQILENPAPLPRPLPQIESWHEDTWDFLKPVSRQRIRETNSPRELLPAPHAAKE
jgi:hypothetical protein